MISLMQVARETGRYMYMYRYVHVPIKQKGGGLLFVDM